MGMNRPWGRLEEWALSLAVTFGCVSAFIALLVLIQKAAHLSGAGKG